MVRRYFLSRYGSGEEIAADRDSGVPCPNGDGGLFGRRPSIESGNCLVKLGSLPVPHEWRSQENRRSPASNGLGEIRQFRFPYA